VFTNAYAVEMLYLVQVRNLILGQDGPVLGPVKKENIMTEIDNDLFMSSTDIMCGTCVAL